MTHRTHPIRWTLAAAACLTLAAAVWNHTALAAEKSDEERIENRMTKDADAHLKNNISDEQKRELLKKEILRAEAFRQMAATLAADPKFKQEYKTLITDAPKRKADVMPNDKEITKEKSKIINDDDAMRMVMAKAMVLLEHAK